MIDPFVNPDTISDVQALRYVCRELQSKVGAYRELKHQLEKQLKEMHESNKRKTARLEEEEEKHKQTLYMLADADLKYHSLMGDYKQVNDRMFRQEGTIRALRNENDHLRDKLPPLQDYIRQQNQQIEQLKKRLKRYEGVKKKRETINIEDEEDEA